MDRQLDKTLTQQQKSNVPATPPKPAPFRIARRRLVFPRTDPFGCTACSCFPAGTLVLTADGSRKPIEKIRRGERVWGLNGINNVIGVESPVLGSRTMLQMSDGSLRWSAEHSLWTLRDGVQWWGTQDKTEAEWEIAQGVFGGLTRSRPLRALARKGETYAHVEGWKTLDAIEVPATQSTRLYYIRTDGCHSAIMDGFVVSAAINDLDFDYTRVNWRGLAAQRIEDPELAAV